MAGDRRGSDRDLDFDHGLDRGLGRGLSHDPDRRSAAFAVAVFQPSAEPLPSLSLLFAQRILPWRSEFLPRLLLPVRIGCSPDLGYLPALKIVAVRILPALLAGASAPIACERDKHKTPRRIPRQPRLE